MDKIFSCKYKPVEPTLRTRYLEYTSPQNFLLGLPSTLRVPLSSWGKFLLECHLKDHVMHRHHCVWFCLVNTTCRICPCYACRQFVPLCQYEHAQPLSVSVCFPRWTWAFISLEYTQKVDKCLVNITSFASGWTLPVPSLQGCVSFIFSVSYSTQHFQSFMLVWTVTAYI